MAICNIMLYTYVYITFDGYWLLFIAVVKTNLDIEFSRVFVRIYSQASHGIAVTYLRQKWKVELSAASVFGFLGGPHSKLVSNKNNLLFVFFFFKLIV